MSDLPCGWVQAKLGDVVDRIEAGKSFRCIERPPEAGQRGLVKISAVTWGDFREYESKTVPDGITVDDHLRIVEGDLLISRANTIELVGACVQAIAHSRELYLSDKVLRLATPLIMRPWIKHYLATPAARKAIGEASTGNQLSMRNISQGALLALDLPLAPPAEQQRIADKLDNLLARIDACRDRLDRLPSLIDRLRQSALTSAIQGSLTADWRAANGGVVAGSEAETDEAAARSVSGWTYERADAACSKVQSGGTPREGFIAAGGAPFLKVYNLVGQQVDFAYRPQFIANEIHHGSMRKSITLPGDVLMNIVGPPLGGRRQLSWPPCCLTKECYPLACCRSAFSCHMWTAGIGWLSCSAIHCREPPRRGRRRPPGWAV